MNFDLQKHARILIIIAYCLLGAAGAYFLLGKIIPFLMPFMFALLCAFFISPVVNRMEKRLRIPRKLSSVVVILLVAGLLVALLAAVAVKAYNAAEELVYGMIGNGAEFEGLRIISDEFNRIFGAHIDLAESFKNLIAPAAQALVGLIKPIATGAPQFFVSVIVFILATHFFVSDRERIFEFFDKWTKGSFTRFVGRIENISKDSIVRYIRAQAILMTVTFVELLIGFTVLRVFGVLNLSYTFGVCFGIALLDALPIFGTGGVMVPWAVYAVISGDFVLAACLLAIYAVCFTVRQLLEPKVLGESLGIHPLITLLAMFVGLRSIGIPGLIFFPLAIVLCIQLVKIGVFGDSAENTEIQKKSDKK